VEKAMSPLLVQFLRRLAVLALGVAALTAFGPRVLRELGVIGPKVPEAIAGAESSLTAARRYGADDAMPAVQEAMRHLEEARALEARGEGRRARRAAAAAAEQAILAQGQALARREQRRRQAQAITSDIDRMLNSLEELYGRISPGLGKAQTTALLSRLKSGRQTGAALILAFDQGNYARVIADEAATRKALEAVREEMKAAGK
jgi:hydroxylamine reductase (hybrid-cluster protein)